MGYISRGYEGMSRGGGEKGGVIPSMVALDQSASQCTMAK